ncbi:MAG TPA: SigE family RNA polymerase sigma factor [Nocardioides sp.]
MPHDGPDARFAEFARDATRPLTNLALALTGDRAEADDLVQDTLVSLWRRWREVEPEHPFAYARAALVRTHVSSLRRPHRRRERAVDATSLPDDLRPTGSSAPPPGPEEASADRDVLRLALETMPTRQRQVVVLRYLEDLSVADVADLLGCTQGTVKRSTHTGLAALRRAYAAADASTASTPALTTTTTDPTRPKGASRDAGPARPSVAG